MQNVFQRGFVSHGLIVLFVEIKQSSQREGSDHFSCWPCNAMSISCLTSIELLKPRYPRIYHFILLPLVASIHSLPTPFFCPTALVALPGLVLSHLVTNPIILPIFFTSPQYTQLCPNWSWDPPVISRGMLGAEFYSYKLRNGPQHPRPSLYNQSG